MIYQNEDKLNNSFFNLEIKETINKVKYLDINLGSNILKKYIYHYLDKEEALKMAHAIIKELTTPPYQLSLMVDNVNFKIELYFYFHKLQRNMNIIKKFDNKRDFDNYYFNQLWLKEYKELTEEVEKNSINSLKRANAIINSLDEKI